MKFVKFIFILVYALFFTSLVFCFDIQEVKIFISLVKSQIIYNISFDTDERNVKLILNRDISSIRLNGSVIKPRKSVDADLNIYYIDLPKSGRYDLEIMYNYYILRECKTKSIVAFSEVMRSLPYFLVEKENLNISSSITIEIPDNEDIEVFIDGKVYKPSYGKIFVQQRKYNSPIVIGYLSLVDVNYNGFKVSITFPKGNEGIALSIASFVNLSRSFIASKFGLRLPESIKVVYLPNSLFSEAIEDTIIVNRIVDSFNDYFSNLDKLEDFILITHEMLHLAMKKYVSEDFINIFEGFIHYMSIQVLSEVFGSSYIEDVVFNNYVSQVRFSYLARKSDLFVVRYNKYPLIFRYISSVVGRFPLISLFSYLSSLNNLNLDVFQEAFRNITGVNFSLFYPLFDGLPTLWNLELSFSGDSFKVYSTAPTKISTSVYVKTSEFETNFSVEIPKDSYANFVFNVPIESVIINPFRNFPEMFYYDNYSNLNVPAVVSDFIDRISYLLNTEDFSKVKNIIPSKSLRDKISKYLLRKREIFGSRDVKVFLENISRFNNQIILEVIFVSGVKYVQGFIVITYGKSYYISNFSIMIQ
ncbi:MAG: hypothetical protein ACK4F9_00850 [Brevinematia bacterium]